jgi:hypothetical protein
MDTLVSQLCATSTGFVVASPTKLQSFNVKYVIEEEREILTVEPDRAWNFPEDTEVLALTLAEEIIAITSDRQMWTGVYEKEGEEVKKLLMSRG